MFRQLPSVVTLVALALTSLPAWGSDGDIAIVAGLLDKHGRKFQGAECDYWLIKWNDASETGVPPFGTCTPPTLKVYAVLEGASAQGITGVEFAVRMGPDVFPDVGYIMFEIPAPGATVTLGSAFTPPDPERRGMNITWDTCQTGDQGRRLLETIVVIPTVPCGPSQRPPEFQMTVSQHSHPSNIYFRCPLFTLCDGPVYTKVCLGDDIVLCQTQTPPFPNDSQCSTSGRFVINGSGSLGSCGVPKGFAPAPLEQGTWSELKSLYR